jgi:cysteate synthase
MADNLQAAKAAELFLQTEGIDIHPAPAIALATLIDEVNKGNIDAKATIMLNITGGGEKRATEGKELWYLKPSLIFDLDPNEAEVIEKVEILFK